MRKQAQVKSILAGWCTDLSHKSRKLRIRCFSRNGRNQTLGLPDGEREARRAGGWKGLPCSFRCINELPAAQEHVHL